MKYLKMALFSLLFIVLMVNASAITINSPMAEQIETESVIYLNITTSLTNPTCVYNIQNTENITLADCANQWIELPFNNPGLHYEIKNEEVLLAHINITVYETNGTDSAEDTVLFHLDNEFGKESKGVLVSSLIGFIFLLSFILWYPCFKLDSLHVPIKFGLTIAGFFMPLVGLIASRSAIELYIHSEALKSIFDSLIVGYTWLLYVIISYFIIIFLLYLFDLFMDYRKKQKGDLA